MVTGKRHNLKQISINKSLTSYLIPIVLAHLRKEHYKYKVDAHSSYSFVRKCLATHPPWSCQQFSRFFSIDTVPLCCPCLFHYVSPPTFLPVQTLALAYTNKTAKIA